MYKREECSIINLHEVVVGQVLQKTMYIQSTFIHLFPVFVCVRAVYLNPKQDKNIW